MRAVLQDRPGHVWVDDIDLLPVEKGDVVVETAAAFSCWTDVIQRRIGGQLPGAHVRGHTAVGRVLEIGPDVTRARVGDRVVVAAQPTCGSCFWCLRGQCTQCGDSTPRPMGVMADGTPLRGSSRVGAYAERMKVLANSVVPIDTGLPDSVVSTLGCGVGAGLSAAFNIATIRPGDTVGVLGVGVYGMSILQGARVSGAGRIIAVDPVAERRELALRLGATDVLDPTGVDVVDVIKGLTGGRGVDVAFEAVGQPVAMENAFKMARVGGDVIMGGYGVETDTVTFNMNDLAFRGKRIMSSQIGNINLRRDIPTFIGMIERGQVDVESMISKNFTFEEINEAYDLQESREIMGAVIVP